MTQTPHPAKPILLVDDERPWLRSLALMLERKGGFGNLLLCDDGREVMDILSQREISLVLLDLTMPHQSGQELLTQIAEEHPGLPVIILTGLNQLETAVKCMQLGAYDFFVKTTEEERLVAGIRRALQMQELEGENRQLKKPFLGVGLQKPEAFSPLITCSGKMQSIFQYLEAVAPSGHPILITGESGVGKELVARAIHALSRPGAPCVAVNTAGLDDQVFSDTLFGHVRGAYTGADQSRAGMIEQAAGGTFCLDEIGDLKLPSQVKLLRLLQEREYYPLGSDRPKRVNARLIFSTNRDLPSLMQAGEFRRDLYYRLCAHQVHIPPLRQRPEDIPLLFDHFLAEIAAEQGKPRPTPPPELYLLLANYDFPGNIRELRAMVVDAVSLHRGKKLSMDSFRQAMQRSIAPPASTARAGAVDFSAILPSLHRLPHLRDVPQALISEALRRSQGNQRLAASLLGISQPAIHKRLKGQKAAGSPFKDS